MPDKFGHALIDTWLATQGRSPGSFNAIERLCYVGRRGTGALEFAPVMGPRNRAADRIRVDKLVDLASEILTRRHSLAVSFAGRSKERALQDILRVGSSAGGARAKALIVWNPATNEVRSGQIEAGDGFVLDDFRTCARGASMKRGRAEAIMAEVHRAVSRWPDYADAAGIPPAWRDRIYATLRLASF